MVIRTIHRSQRYLDIGSGGARDCRRLRHCAKANPSCCFTILFFFNWDNWATSNRVVRCAWAPRNWPNGHHSVHSSGSRLWQTMTLATCDTTRAAGHGRPAGSYVLPTVKRRMASIPSSVREIGASQEICQPTIGPQKYNLGRRTGPRDVASS
jgi:hypothetical protein